MERYVEQGNPQDYVLVDKMGLEEIEETLKLDGPLKWDESEIPTKEDQDREDAYEAWIEKHGGREVHKPVWE